MKLLVFHNTLAEYRIGFFNELSKICALTVVFTDYGVAEKVYGTKIDETMIDFNYKVLLGRKKNRIRKSIEIVETMNPDWIVIPALDDLYSIILASKLMTYSHSKHIKVGLFWEKWCWNYSCMPMFRLLKELVKRFLVSPIIKKCDALFAPGRKTAEYLKFCGADNNKIYKIHDASEILSTKIENVYQKYSIDKDKKLVLYLGRIVFYKGLDNLIRAFASLPEDYRRSHVLLVCGDGPERMNCEKLREQYGLNIIIFTGTILPSERRSYFEYSSVFVLPGRAYKGEIEAWGLSLNEAMQFNNILISTTSVGAAYELINENNGVMIEQNSIHEITDALLMAEKKELNKVRNENEKLFKLYNYKRMAKDIVDTLEGSGICFFF